MTASEDRGGLRAFEVVLGWVEARILAGELKVGDVLPAERELAKQLEVSRAAVREAVRALQAQGVVRSSVGAGAAGGTTIMAMPAHALSRFLRLHVALANFPLGDVVESRIALERLSVRLAARNASATDLEAMRGALLRTAEAGVGREAFNDGDTEFHLAIAEAARNRLVTDLTVAIRESMRQPILERFRRVGDWPGLVERLRAEHDAIYAAIAAGDADRAEELVESHIRSSWSELAGD